MCMFVLGQLVFKLVVVCLTPYVEYDFHEIKNCVLTLLILTNVYNKHYTIHRYSSHPGVNHHYKQRLMSLLKESEEVEGLY